jgi:hypothetical protein
MMLRLPIAGTLALQAGRSGLSGGQLHQALLRLIRGFHYNYAMTFPALNTPQVLFQYVRELALPREFRPGMITMPLAY